MTNQTKKLSKTKILLAFVCLSLLIFATGCTTDTENETKNVVEQNQQQSDSMSDKQMPNLNENFNEALSGDLETGLLVLVVGIENDSGSVSAEQIMIGNGEDDFKNMRENMGSPINDVKNDNPQPVQPSNDIDNERPNFDQMQNMSEEERVQLREKMQSQRGTSDKNFARANIDGGITRLIGEIIDIDDSTITLKISTGGSSLIFYSQNTKILKIKESTE